MKRRQILINDVPNDLIVHFVVAMNEDIAEGDDLALLTDLGGRGWIALVEPVECFAKCRGSECRGSDLNGTTCMRGKELGAVAGARKW